MYKLRVGLPARLQVQGIRKVWDAQATTITTVSSEIRPELGGKTNYAGFRQPHFFLVDLLISNPENELKPGMVGSARIYGQRRSVANLAWREIARFLGRNIW